MEWFNISVPCDLSNAGKVLVLPAGPGSTRPDSINHLSHSQAKKTNILWSECEDMQLSSFFMLLCMFLSDTELCCLKPWSCADFTGSCQSFLGALIFSHHIVSRRSHKGQSWSYKIMRMVLHFFLLDCSWIDTFLSFEVTSLWAFIKFWFGIFLTIFWHKSNNLSMK